MSPSHVVGLANGLAQSTVSLARFIGPIIGGAVSAKRFGVVEVSRSLTAAQVWSASINGNPSGYFAGFYVVTLGCIIQLALSFFVR